MTDPIKPDPIRPDPIKRLDARFAALSIPAEVDPPADLWPRIAHARHRVARRRRWSRVAVGGIGAIAVCAIALQLAPTRQVHDEIDWRARAEALEFELHAIAHDSRTANVAEASAELDRVDHALQAAYDSGAAGTDLAPLWKRRSELLATLIQAREQRLAVTRI